MNKISGILIAMLMVVSVTTAFAGNPGSDNVPLIIGFKNKPSEADKDTIRGLGGEVKYSYTIINAIAAKLPEQAIDALNKNPNIAYVETDGEVHALGQTLPWGVDRIDADVVNTYDKGTGVKVAVIDTGINYTHPDLTNNYRDGYDFVNKDTDPMDDNGHGTHVAGTIAAVDNDFGVVGAAPEAYLYGVKVLGSGGSGSLSDVIAGIDWSVTNGMQIISMSLGTTSDSISLHDAVDKAYNVGVLLVAAAGNSGNPAGTGDTVIYPAKYSSVIAVAATDSSNVRASWSSTGPDVELSAPGVSILSTYLNGNYATMSGTSMATPHVSGTAALILNSDETVWKSAGYTNGDGIWTNVEIRDVLDGTATDLGATGRDNLYGYGLVNASKAAPSSTPTPTPDTTPPAQVTGVTVTTVSSSQLNVSWNANAEPDLSHYNIYRSTTSGFFPNASNLVSSPATNVYSDTALIANIIYYYKVAAVDSSGNEGSPSIEASGRTNALPSDAMYVASINMSKTTYKATTYKAKVFFTYATAIVTVVNATGFSVAGANVSGHWSGLTTDSDTGTTDTSGRIALNSDAVKNAAGAFTFTVDSITKAGLTYYPAANSETSDSITV
jgi:subtilisin